LFTTELYPQPTNLHASKMTHSGVLGIGKSQAF